MNTSLLAAFVLFLSSCAHVPGRSMTVQWPDESQEKLLWACFEDQDNEGVMLCLDWADFLRHVAEERAKDEAEEEDRIDRMRNLPEAKSL